MRAYITVPRNRLALAGVVLLLAAPPLQLVSSAAFFAVWYAGVTLTGVWLVLDIRARNKPDASRHRDGAP